MALQASGRITATDIMAEFSYPASTAWKVSADGAGFISFTVGSIIKYSDFYSASAAPSAQAFTFPGAQGDAVTGTGGYEKQLNGGSGILSTAEGMIIRGSDTPNPISITSGIPSSNFSSTMVINQNQGEGSTGTFGVNMMIGWTANNGPPSNGWRGARATYELPVTATSGTNYEFWANYKGQSGYIGGNSMPNNVGDCYALRLRCGSYSMYWGFVKDFTLQQTIGTNGGRNTSTLRGEGQIYGNDTYIGRCWNGCADPRDNFTSQGSLGCTQATGAIFDTIPGSQIIAAGNKVFLDVMMGTYIAFSGQGCFIQFGGLNGQGGYAGVYPHFGLPPENSTDGPTPVPPDNFGNRAKMGGYTGAADPNGVDAVYGNTDGADRGLFEIVPAGTY